MTSKLFTLNCKNQRDLLPEIISTMYQLGLEIETISQSRTDIPEIVLITIEVAMPGVLIDNTIINLKKIADVLDVTITFGSVLNAALFKISFDKNENIWEILHRYNVRCISIENNTLLIHQIAKEGDIQRLYNALEGPGLISFSQLPLSNYQSTI
ncbi:acetolactate synthase small subunit [Sphingobacterium sp. JUb20]|nr:acetolactate synthase small subunit [Sphingobacterium sp. JUb20]